MKTANETTSQRPDTTKGGNQPTSQPPAEVRIRYAGTDRYFHSIPKSVFPELK